MLMKKGATSSICSLQVV